MAMTSATGRQTIAALSLIIALSNTSAMAAPDQTSISPELTTPHLIKVAAGRRLNFHCVGTGTPTVVFEQGGEGLITNWRKVQPAITRLTRTCFYDRAGFGYSDPPDKPVTAISVTDDLRALLKKAGVASPVVLVGHSVGGFYATMYADRFSDAVAGLVLVEPGFAGQQVRRQADRQVVDQAHIRQGEGNLVRCGALARAKVLTRANLSANRCYPAPADMPPSEARYIIHSVTRPSFYEAEESQSVNYFSGDNALSVSAQQEKEAARSFRGMPIVVLSASIYPGDGWETDAELRGEQENWQTGHKALAARSALGSWKVVPDSHHFVQLDQPDAVITAINGVVAQVRASDGQRH